jgi:hypothetical protein
MCRYTYHKGGRVDKTDKGKCIIKQGSLNNTGPVLKGRSIVETLRGTADIGLTTDEILTLTRPRAPRVAVSKKRQTQ